MPSELPDVDPYEHLTNAEIAAAVLAWPEGSDDQLQALAALARRSPRGFGDNRPPLLEALEAETASLRRRAEEIIALDGTIKIIDMDSAQKAIDIEVKAKDVEDEAKLLRLARSKPARDTVDLINNYVNGIVAPVAIMRGGLRTAIAEFNNRRRAAAEAERRRLAEEQRKREAEAAEAQRQAEEAARAGKGQIGAELDAAQARERADRARRNAEAIRPEPIRSHLGQVSQRREITFDVSDLGAVLAWLISQPGLRNKIEQAVRTIIGAYLRGALGIDAVARGVDIPGVTVRVEHGAVAVRR